MFTANNRNYSISINLLWGSTDAPAEMVKDARNAVQLDEENLVSFSLTSSLLDPCIGGNFVIRDKKKAGKLLNLVDIPIIYGMVNFMQVDGAGSKYSVETPKPFEQESFSEYIVVRSFEVVENGADFATFSFDFSMADSVVFETAISPFSTFGEEDGAMEFRDVVKALFAASGSKAAFDYDTISVNARVPFISAPNCSFNDAIGYVYRKVFDHDYASTNGKDYCKIVYNNGERKYEMWRFGDVGTASMFKCKSNDVRYVEMREKLSVPVGGESGGTGCTAEFFSNGDARDLHWIFGDKTYTDYDYLTNNFSDTVFDSIDTEFLDHTDIIYSKQRTKSSVIKNNSPFFKTLYYGSHYTRFRDNGSLYDVFNEMLFSSPYTRVRTPGCIGRYAGNCVMLNFVNAELSPFRYSSGVHLITGLTHIVTHNGQDWTFTTVMDTFKPFLIADSEKSETF